MSKGQVWIFSLDGSPAVHRQESGQQSICFTVQTVDLSAERLLCNERMSTYVLVA